MVVSGDGLLHEVYQGFYRRRQAGKLAFELPVLHLPGGSGNGVFASLCHEFAKDTGKAEIYDVMNVLLAAVKFSCIGRLDTWEIKYHSTHGTEGGKA